MNFISLFFIFSIMKHSYDVEHYYINLKVLTDSGLIRGWTEIKAKVDTDLISQIKFHLASEATIDSILKGDTTLSYSRLGDTVFVSLPSVLFYDDTFSIKIFYQTYPSEGLNFTDSSCFTLTEPDDSKYWFPCWDHPSDKAKVDILITIRDDWLVASNGVLVDTFRPEPNWKTYHWRENYPLPTYLIAFAGGYYTIYEQEWNGMPIMNFVFPVDTPNCPGTFQHLPDMLQFYSDSFGYYAFYDEKYGHAVCHFYWGAMENNTITFLGRWLVNPNYEWVLAHELAHHWWGNAVTLEDWKDIWLNEGFATYSEGLWQENFYGEEVFKERLETYAYYYFQEDGSGYIYPIYDPPPEHLFGATIYYKGAWVLHMLRWIVGTPKFFEIMRTYFDTFKYKNANTFDFINICENIYGQDLDWFFDEWIFDVRYPQYTWSWTQENLGDSFKVYLQITQIQTNAPIFQMPIEFAFITLNGDTIFDTLWIDDSLENMSLTFSNQIQNILFDPNMWILKKEWCNLKEKRIDNFISRKIKIKCKSIIGNKIKLSIEGSGEVKLEIFDVAGRKIKTIFQGVIKDKKEITINLPKIKSGIYFLKEKRSGYSKKLICIK